MATPALPLCETLKELRKARRVSQLELALRVGVSQRHISFVENGRSQPSRHLLAGYLQALDAPLPVRNLAMLQAGYAPLYSAAGLRDPVLAQAHDALIQLLRAHDPMPAFVIDADWNLLHINRGGEWLAQCLAPSALQAGSTAPNMLDLMTHPEGFASKMLNLDEIGPSLLAHLREAAIANPALRARVSALSALLHIWPQGRQERIDVAPTMPPVLTARFATIHGELAFFSMSTTFGTPHDITLASLRVEHMFPADARTRALLAEVVATS
jgi:transcriptional regulator with XRE-family HTH domain